MPDMVTDERHSAHFPTRNSIRPPRASTVVGWMVLITGLLIAAFLIFVPWVQTTYGVGTVTALNPNDRVQEINALVPGRKQEWFVRDGSHVTTGDPIVRIADIDPNLIERLQAERQQFVAILDSAQIAVETAQIDLDRMRSLFDKGLAARRDYEQARIRVEELRTRVAQASAELNRVDVNLSRQSVQIVRAPRDGVILRVNAGDSATVVSAGDVVATFVPDNVERAVELYIDGQDIALVRLGARVRMQFEGWPVVQFSGWPSVAVGTFGGVIAAVDPSASTAGQFRVLVTEDMNDPNPWPDQSFVRFGSSARGWILLETVASGYELWRQLNNFPANMPDSVQTGAANER
jgi:multidrug efflux pump subunit AcrA (membrane-fusion protein)